MKKEIKLISDIAKYFGVIYGEKKFKVLAEQDIYILNSRNEGMPMSIIESLITGIPCFISKESNMEEYIKKYDCGWIYRREKISLFEALKECIQNYRKNKKKYMENSKKCGQSFYWNNLEKIYQEAYLKMR